MVKFGKYFCGNEISAYGLENGFVDYSTLAKSFDCVLNNDIMGVLESKGFYFDIINGYPEESEEETEEMEELPEIFQYYIITGNGADILQEYTKEIVFYCEDIDLYIWGVTHYGTAWNYVLTDIPCGNSEE